MRRAYEVKLVSDDAAQQGTVHWALEIDGKVAVDRFLDPETSPHKALQMLLKAQSH